MYRRGDRFFNEKTGDKSPMHTRSAPTLNALACPGGYQGLISISWATLTPPRTRSPPPLCVTHQKSEFWTFCLCHLAVRLLIPFTCCGKPHRVRQLTGRRSQTHGRTDHFFKEKRATNPLHTRILPLSLWIPAPPVHLAYNMEPWESACDRALRGQEFL